MDLLHHDDLPGTVAIGSSDADFAPLAVRLREAGIRVICFALRDKADAEALALATTTWCTWTTQGAERAERTEPPVKAARKAPAARKTAARPAAPKAEPARKSSGRALAGDDEARASWMPCRRCWPASRCRSTT